MAPIERRLLAVRWVTFVALVAAVATLGVDAGSSAWYVAFVSNTFWYRAACEACLT